MLTKQEERQLPQRQQELLKEDPLFSDLYEQQHHQHINRNINAVVVKPEPICYQGNDPMFFDHDDDDLSIPAPTIHDDAMPPLSNNKNGLEVIWSADFMDRDDTGFKFYPIKTEDDFLSLDGGSVSSTSPSTDDHHPSSPQYEENDCMNNNNSNPDQHNNVIMDCLPFGHATKPILTPPGSATNSPLIIDCQDLTSPSLDLVIPTTITDAKESLDWCVESIVPSFDMDTDSDLVDSFGGLDALCNWGETKPISGPFTPNHHTAMTPPLSSLSLDSSLKFSFSSSSSKSSTKERRGSSGKSKCAKRKLKMDLDDDRKPSLKSAALKNSPSKTKNTVKSVIKKENTIINHNNSNSHHHNTTHFETGSVGFQKSAAPPLIPKKKRRSSVEDDKYSSPKTVKGASKANLKTTLLNNNGQFKTKSNKKHTSSMTIIKTSTYYNNNNTNSILSTTTLPRPLSSTKAGVSTPKGATTLSSTVVVPALSTKQQPYLPLDKDLELISFFDSILIDSGMGKNCTSSIVGGNTTLTGTSLTSPPSRRKLPYVNTTIPVTISTKAKTSGSAYATAVVVAPGAYKRKH